MDKILINQLKTLYSNKDFKTNKSSFNRTLIIGGSPTYPGAFNIASKACLCTGVGYVASLKNKNFLLNDEVINESLSINIKKFKSTILKYKTILFGNGLKENFYNKLILKKLLKYLNEDQTLIIDATGISIYKNLAKLKYNCKLILTPHVGEFINLYNLNDKKSNVLIYKDFINSITQNNKNLYIVLKSYDLLISNDGNDIIIEGRDNNLAKAGTGDCLAGLIAGFASNLDILSSIQIAYNLILESSKDLKKYKANRTILITDIIKNIPFIIKNIIQ